MFQNNMKACVAAAAFLVASSSGFAQFESGTTPSVIEGGIPGPGTVLWDNTNIAVDNGIVSLQANNLPAGSNQVISADDFVVPTGETWNINFVFSVGATSAGASDPDSIGIEFFNDNAGLPGSMIASYSIPLGGVVTPTTQELTLPTPMTLGEGTYWVSIYGIYNTFVDLTTTRWNWSTGPTTINNIAALQDTGSFFGSPLPWTALTDLGVVNTSASFALRGAVQNGTVLPPPAEVPTLSSAGLAGMALVLLAVGGLVFRRRAN